MDFFKFISASDATELEEGELINGIDKSTWIERYREPGEFTFEAKLSSGLREFLPLGTIISHTDTLDMMIVENHEIDEREDEDSVLIITGRSFLSILDQRVVGATNARADTTIYAYTLADDYSWNQIQAMLEAHAGSGAHANDQFTDVVFDTDVSGTPDTEERTVDLGNLLARTLDFLAIDDLGIRVIRKNTFGVGTAGNTTFLIHAGVNRTNEVLFTWYSGDISANKYLYTIKNAKNAVLIRGKWMYTVVETPGVTKYNLRMMHIEARDIDEQFSALPTGLDGIAVYASLVGRGREALAAHRQIALTQTDISNMAQYTYRRDYDIGDLISIGANFGEIEIMRVVEFAEIQDSTGYSGHPTLEILGA